MGCSYLVLRKSSYHFRMTVPADVRGYIGRGEIHVSLREGECRKARLKVGLFAFEVRRLIQLVRNAVKTLSDGEVRALVAGWRQRMVDKDSAIRRKIEAGLEPLSLARYETNCAGIADALGSIMDAMAPEMPDSADGSERHVPNPKERDRAFAEALEHATHAEGDDFAPIVAATEFAELDELSQRTLLLSWMPAAANLFAQKAEACRTVGSRLPDHSLAPAPRAASLALSSREQTPLSAAWSDYLAHMAATHSAWKSRPAGKATLAGQTFVGLIGRDKPIGTITREDFDRYEWFANHRPPRSNGSDANEDLLALEHTLKSASTLPTVRLGRRTVEEYLQRVVRFFDWAKAKGYVKEHYAAGMAFKLGNDGGDGSTDRLPWTSAEIKTILDPVAMRRFTASRTRTAQSKDRWTYLPWFLLLACYSGARRNEIAGLTVDDVIEREEGGATVPLILIRKNEVRPRLKNKAAERSVPIHPHLIQLGLMKLAHKRKAAGHQRLLWNTVSGKDVGTKISNDFSDYLKAIDLFDPEGRKVLHSFRHSFKTTADGYMSASAVDSVIGHQRKDSTGGRYVHYLEIPRREHHAALAKLDFGLDLEGLKALLSESTLRGA